MLCNDPFSQMVVRIKEQRPVPQLGCPLVQGYLIAKPQTAGRLLEWLPTSQFGFSAPSTAVDGELAS